MGDFQGQQVNLPGGIIYYYLLSIIINYIISIYL